MSKTRGRYDGREPIEINPALLESLCALPRGVIEQDEIITILRHATPGLKVSKSTVQRFIKRNYGLTFDQYRVEKEGIMKHRLRAKQLEIAYNGNVSMLIWLGKQYLGQGDKVQAAVSHQGEQYTPPVYNIQSKSNDKDE